jgi:hypothetical protein
MPPDQLDFLNKLAKHKSDFFDGRLVIINFRDSIRQKLVDANTAQRLLSRCVSHLNLQASLSAEDRKDIALVFQEVCKGLDTDVEPPFVRSCHQQSQANDGDEWSTIVGYTTFADALVDHTKLSAASAAPVEKNFTKLTKRKIQRALKDVLLNRAWVDSALPVVGAHLARPIRGTNCWISSRAFDTGLVTAPEDTGDIAWQTRRSTGLPADNLADRWALRFRFSAKAARQSINNQVARPTFADNGSEWFRVREYSTNDSHYASLGWGHTQNILHQPSLPRVGRPERVAPPLAIDRLVKLEIDVLGPDEHGLSASKGTELKLQDFLDLQLAGQTVDEALNDLNHLLS